MHFVLFYLIFTITIPAIVTGTDRITGVLVLKMGNISLNPADTARYTEDMLISLRKLALKQQQGLLAHLLYLAAVEAESIRKSYPESSPHDTLLP